ncbi:MAG: hypothetical protein U9N34_01100 [Candidatus Cloacimonadota bacterium]|nr:hypothetical protein [Candidatus Cloacimonadota bacterium]
MRNKIITNYKIVDSKTNDWSNPTKIPKVAKNTKVNLSEEKLLHKINDNDAKNTIHKVDKKKQPAIKINKDEDGIITSIDIKCESPASFTIELDY